MGGGGGGEDNIAQQTINVTCGMLVKRDLVRSGIHAVHQRGISCYTEHRTFSNPRKAGAL